MSELSRAVCDSVKHGERETPAQLLRDEIIEIMPTHYRPTEGRSKGPIVFKSIDPTETKRVRKRVIATFVIITLLILIIAISRIISHRQ